MSCNETWICLSPNDTYDGATGDDMRSLTSDEITDLMKRPDNEITDLFSFVLIRKGLIIRSLASVQILITRGLNKQNGGPV